MSHKTEYIWTCKIGGPAIQFQSGADLPMRQAVQTAFKQVTGNDEAFCFSGWGGELTEPERAVVENRLPSAEYEAEWNRRAAVEAAQPEAVGWVTAVQSFADELELPFLEAKSFLDEVFPQWMADKEAAGFVTLRLDDLTEGDSYGVDGSDFYRCRICHAESGAGMLNNGIKHEHDCPLASAPTPEPMSAPTEAKPAQQDAVDAERPT